MMKGKLYSGFTLVELLVGLAVLAVLVSIAVPSMQSTIRDSSIRTVHREHLSALNYARSEAVSRGFVVSMCPSNDATTCNAGATNWSDGWLVFIDNGAGANRSNGTFDADEELLKVYENQGIPVFFQDPEDSNNHIDSISWNFRGFTLNQQRALLVVCDRDNVEENALGLLVERSGRVSLTRDSNGDGIHESAYEDNNGVVVFRDLSCS